jgi:hypothetical protein
VSTFLELQTEVLARGFDSTAYTTRVKEWINQALRVTARRMKVRTAEATSTITTTSGTATSTLPSDFLRVRSIKENADDYNLVFYESITDFDGLGDTSTGKPTAYTLDGANIRFWPIPDSSSYTFALRYWKSNATLSANGDIPSVIPTDWHHLLVYYATAEAFLAEDDPEQHKYYRDLYESELRIAMVDLQDQSEDGAVQVKGMWSEPGQL